MFLLRSKALLSSYHIRIAAGTLGLLVLQRLLYTYDAVYLLPHTDICALVAPSNAAPLLLHTTTNE